MNDEQLIQLIQETPPEELTGEELQLLRDRLPDSPALREALSEQLRLDQQLAETLGQVSLSVDTILSEPSESWWTWSHGLLVLLGVVCVLGLVSTIVTVVLWKPRPDDSWVEVVIHDGGNPDDPNGNGGNPNPNPAPNPSPPPTPPKPAPPKPSGKDGTTETKTLPVEPKIERAWDQALRAPSLPFDEAWPILADSSDLALAPQDIRQWFAPVDGYPSRFVEADQTSAECGAMEGLFRLQAPLMPGTMLQLAPVSPEGLQIHLFHGEQGVTIRHYAEGQEGWAAYATTRKPNSPVPATFALTSTDGGIARHSEVGLAPTWLLWYRKGEVVVSLGDVEVLRAPLPGPPKAVYFEGKVGFHELTLRPVHRLPSSEMPPIASSITKPAVRKWRGVVPEAALVTRMPHGEIQLSANQTKQPAWIATKLPRSGLHVVDLLIDNVTPGAGVFLGTAGGTPLNASGTTGGHLSNSKNLHVTHWVIGLKRDRRSQRLCVDPWPLTARATEKDFPDIRLAPLPCVSQSTPLPKTGPKTKQLTEQQKRQPHAMPKKGRLWIRLVSAPGYVKYWISTDQIHWAPAKALPSHGVHGIEYVGIACSAEMPDCQIQLRRIIQRSLTSLSALAPAELQGRVPLDLAKQTKFADWSAAVNQSRPEKVDASAWRRACALVTLGAGCDESLGHELFDLLLSSKPALALSWKERLRLLREVAIWSGPWESGQEKSLSVLVQRHRALANSAFDAGVSQPFTLIRQPLMSLPLVSRHPYSALDPSLIEKELITLVYQEQWSQVARLCRQLRYASGSNERLDQVAPLWGWACALAQQHTKSPLFGKKKLRFRPQWHPVLVEDLSKEAYSLSKALSFSLKDRFYLDAAKAISKIDPQSARELAPSLRDDRLLLPVSATIDIAMRRHPELRQTMNKEFGDLANLCVRRAMTARNVEGVQLATMQFAGTTAATQGHQWLGDRALSGAQFPQALVHYRLAMTWADLRLRTALMARIRLASAMLGRDVGEKVTQPIEWGGTQFTGKEFESMIAEMLRRHAGSHPLRRRGIPPRTYVGPAPLPCQFKVNVYGKIDAGVQERPRFPRRAARIGRHDVDWIGLRLAMNTDSSALYVNNQLQVTAYDIATGREKWRSPVIPGHRDGVATWMLVAMRPVIFQGKVFARRLVEDGAVLLCLDRKDGGVVWASHCETTGKIISDPIVLNDQIFAFSAVRQPNSNTYQLHLVRFDPDTGREIFSRPIIQLRKTWFHHHYCRAVIAGDTILAALGGSVVCCDAAGRVKWVRRETVLPSDSATAWFTRHFDRPIVDGSQIFVVQPGVRVVECIEQETGRLLWQHVQADLVGMVGIAGDQLIVRTERGLLALSRKTGKVTWLHRAEKMLDATWCGEKGGIVYSRPRPLTKKDNPAINKEAAGKESGVEACPELVWLDVTTGQIKAKTSLPTLATERPRLGPIHVHRGKIWAMAGRSYDETDVSRKVIELIPSGNATP